MFLHLEFKTLLRIKKHKLTAFFSPKKPLAVQFCSLSQSLHHSTYRQQTSVFVCNGLKEGFVPKFPNRVLKCGGILPSIICNSLRAYFPCITFFPVFFLMHLNDLEQMASSKKTDKLAVPRSRIQYWGEIGNRTSK